MMALSKLKDGVNEIEIIRKWLINIGETDKHMIDYVIDQCTFNPEAREFYAKYAQNKLA